jgi:hypothetical protein
MGLQEVRWGKSGGEPAKDCILSYGNVNGTYCLWKDFTVHNVIRYAVKLLAFVSDGISCKIQRGRWCDIIFLHLHAPVDNKSDGKEKLERALDQFCTYHMEILFRGLSEK